MSQFFILDLIQLHQYYVNCLSIYGNCAAGLDNFIVVGNYRMVKVTFVVAEQWTVVYKVFIMASFRSPTRKTYHITSNHRQIRPYS